MELNEKVFELHDQGVSAGKIAQKLKIKKSVVLDILGEAGKSKGLGDIITKATEVTGLDKVAEAVADAVGADDCGCKARAKALNKLFPLRKLNDLSNEDYEYLNSFYRNKKSYIDAKTQGKLIEIYNRIFNSKRVVSNCSPCVSKLVDELETIYNEAR